LDVRASKLWGLMSFPENFTGHLKERLLFGVYTDQGNLNGSRITFRLDMSSNFLFPFSFHLALTGVIQILNVDLFLCIFLDKQIGLQVQKNLYSTLKDFMYQMARNCKVDTSGLDTPLHVRMQILAHLHPKHYLQLHLHLHWMQLRWIIGISVYLQFATPVYGTDDTNFTEFVAPGLLIGYSHLKNSKTV